VLVDEPTDLPVSFETPITGTCVKQRTKSPRVEPTTRVYALVKSDRNPFRQMLTIGRASNNDIIIDSPAVSKVHAYIAIAEDGAHSIADQRSRNGTHVDGKRLADRETVPLADGVRIQLADGVVLAYYHLATLERLKATTRQLRPAIEFSRQESESRVVG
jgi:pSer/pThr/pTyr-binding forkhead associated (FHA) protein